jgi:hypothetical protein
MLWKRLLVQSFNTEELADEEVVFLEHDFVIMLSGKRLPRISKCV